MKSIIIIVPQVFCSDCFFSVSLSLCYIMEVRCRHCCKSLFKGDSILFNAHHEVKQQITDVGCQVDESDCCSYMIPENVPDWIMDVINQVYLIILYYQDFKKSTTHIYMNINFVYVYV